MEILATPVSETEVLAVTIDNVDADAIVKDFEAKGLCCVDHLCGCK